MSKYNSANDILICECGSTEHSMVLRLWDFGLDGSLWEEDPDSNVSLTLEVFLLDSTFWKRLKKGLKYIFGYKSRYGHFDSLEVSYNDAQKIIDRMIQYRQKVEEYREALRKPVQGVTDVRNNSNA
jgi:hypothetical protein